MPYVVSPASSTATATTGTPPLPDRMWAVVRDAWGAPGDVLRSEVVDRPDPGPGEVLVGVRAAGLERGTWHLVTGLPRLLRPAYGLRRPRRRGLGLEVAGVVEAVGPGLDHAGFEVGQAVFGNAVAAFAEHAVVAADQLAPLPAGASFVAAAACPISGSTALQAVRDQAAVRPGQHVLVIGAGGGIGTFAVQVARHLGAEVTGVARTEHLDRVRALGAHHVIDHTAEAIDVHGVRYDAIVDIGGHRSLRELRRSLAPRGRLVIVGSETGGGWLGGTDRQLRALLWSPFLRQRLGAFVSSEAAEHLVELAELVADGSVVPEVDRTYPLEAAAAAMEHLATGHPLGKVVLDLTAR